MNTSSSTLVIIGREPEISIEGLDLGRFDRGELLEAHGLL